MKFTVIGSWHSFFVRIHLRVCGAFAGDQAAFVAEDVNNIIKESIDSVLLNAAYNHHMVCIAVCSTTSGSHEDLCVGLKTQVHFRILKGILANWKDFIDGHSCIVDLLCIQPTLHKSCFPYSLKSIHWQLALLFIWTLLVFQSRKWRPLNRHCMERN